MTIEILQGLERKVLITVNKAEVDKLVKAELKKYAPKAKAPGFRPGKLPEKLLEQMYGSEAFESVVQQKINDQFIQVLSDSDLTPVSFPQFDLTSSEGSEFIFTALFEVLPTIYIGDLSEETVDKPIVAITDEDVETAIIGLRNQFATYETISDEAHLATEGDQLTIDFEGTIDGVQFDGGTATDFIVNIGSKNMLPDLENGLIATTVNETKNITVNFPANYPAANLAGKATNFKVTIKKIAKKVLPELNEEFIRKLGAKNSDLESLKSLIKTNLEHELKNHLITKIRSSALEALYKSTPIEVPKSIVHDEIHDMMNRTKERMKKEGYSEQSINLTHDMFEKDAKKLVTLRLLVQEIIASQKITVSDEDVKEVVSDMAFAYEDSQEYIKWYYSDEERVQTAKSHAIEKKVINYIISLTKINEVPYTFTDLVHS